MTFLIRAAFWLSLVILILPSEPGHEADRSLSTTQALMAAQAAVSDLTSFCARQPDVCATGEVALEGFAAKARYGAKQLYTYLDEEAGANDVAEGDLQIADTTAIHEDQQELTAMVKDLQQ